MSGRGRGADVDRKSRVVRFAEFRWKGVEPREYKDPDARWRDVVRHVLVGPDEGTPFHVRYFEVGPGGHTTLERHGHEHVVVVLRGRGEVRLGERKEELGFGDVVYVAPDDPHQFRAAGDGPFGFLCIVTADRDRPTALQNGAGG
jgi:quercetin dioxygenase-like cupin family protein